jgi:RNA recognition motif-containing protein
VTSAVKSGTPLDAGPGRTAAIDGGEERGNEELIGRTEEEWMGRKLYVGNLPYEVGETELQELFARAGSVESVQVMRDQMTGRGRGFAFVEMSSDDEAQNAIRELHAASIGGRNLTVNEARPKVERGGGFGGGGSSRRRSEPRW